MELVANPNGVASSGAETFATTPLGLMIILIPLPRVARSSQPLDEAGVRDAAERLLAELIGAYAQGTDHTRAAIRRLFREYRSLAWAATLSVPRTTIEGLRQHLILFSITDQGRDSRDALLTLHEICQDAKTAGLEIAPVLREIAAMSSDADKYGMGSTSQMLLRRC